MPEDTQNEGVKAILAAVADSPYVAAAQAVASVIDGAQRRNWQHGVDAKLAEICERLDQINTKLDAVRTSSGTSPGKRETSSSVRFDRSRILSG